MQDKSNLQVAQAAMDALLVSGVPQRRVDPVPVIHRREEGEHKLAVADNGQVKLTVVGKAGEEGDTDWMLRLRRGKKPFAPDERAFEPCWLMAELDGVCVYVDGNTVVVTRDKNLRPVR